MIAGDDSDLTSTAHALDPAAVVTAVHTDPDAGLDEVEAGRRLTANGRNELPAAPPPTRWAMFRREITSPMAILLGVAAFVSGVVLGETVEGVAILAIVILNAVIGVVQEGKAEDALRSLRDLQTPTARVVRQGVEQSREAADLVVGDVVRLSGGDRVPADLRLVGADMMEVDESLLTGESLPVAKDVHPVPVDAQVADRTGIAHSGTFVVRGSGTGVVVATGVRTQIGSIAAALDVPAAPTRLQVELAQLTKRLGTGAALVASAVFVVAALADRGSLSQAFLVAVALAVAAVPEGLPTVVTISLALGVRRMARSGAIVRRMSAVETLGSATVLLTDKTGTLTENQITVDFMVSATGDPLDSADVVWSRLREDAVACTDASLDPPVGDPVDLALLRALDAGRSTDGDFTRRVVLPFDAEHRRMTVVVSDAAGSVLVTKGAPEEIVSRCDKMVDRFGAEQPMTSELRANLAAMAEDAAQRGHKLLLLADRPLTEPPVDLAGLEVGLVCVALIGMSDPVRETAPAAVKSARAAGIDVVMVTGDHPGTAAAIAEAVGIRPGTTVTGSDLANGHSWRPGDVSVFARVDPSQKLTLVEQLQGAGEVVAVTGDGVNDAPALRRADIGVAIGRQASDVAKDAADMVVVDDDLSTIVSAIREGRGAYDNLRKVVDYLVAGNLSEIAVVVVGLIITGGAAILTPLQLLWVNLLTDGLPALALGVDPVSDQVMDRRPRRPSEALLGARRLAWLGARASVLAAGPLAAYAVSYLVLGHSERMSRTIVFTSLVFAHLLYAFAVRPKGSGHSRYLFGAITASVALQTVAVAVPMVGGILGAAALGAESWLLVVAAGVAPVAILALRREPRSDRWQGERSEEGV
jgi:P-type Ca2+ transporter type 2C